MCPVATLELLSVHATKRQLEAVPEKCSLGLTFNDGSLFPHASGDPQNDAVRLHQLLQDLLTVCFIGNYTIRVN